MLTGPCEYLEMLFLRTWCVDVFWRSVLVIDGSREGLIFDTMLKTLPVNVSDKHVKDPGYTPLN